MIKNYADDGKYFKNYADDGKYYLTLKKREGFGERSSARG